jgi:predicted amidohydrolase YtcJ
MKEQKRILFTDGRIFLSEEQIIRGSLLIDGEKIVDCLAEAPADLDAERIDLAGKLLIPGFIDAHTHLFQEGIEMARPDLSGANSKEELLEIVREAVKSHGAGEIIIASDFDESEWQNGQLPSREELDGISDQHPVIVRRICGHMAIANSLALDRIPPAWRGVNRKTGMMKEDVPLNLSRIFPPDSTTMREGLKAAVRRANSLGITSIHEITKLSNVHYFEELARGGGLTLNVRFYIPVEDTGSIEKPEGGFERTTFGGIKLFADGSIGARTAANTFEYRDTPGNSGMLIHKQDELRSYVGAAEEKDIQLVIHAIGNLAIRQVLDAYAHEVKPGNPNRHRIEHAELIDKDDIERIREQGIVVSMQPNFIKLWSQPGGMYERVLGDRYRANNPLGDMKRMGIHVAFGSDTMPMSPLLGIEGVVSAPFDCQRMSMEEAIASYTRSSAIAGFSLNKEGEIGKGKEANLVVLDPAAMSICKTFYRGRCVFED